MCHNNKAALAGAAAGVMGCVRHPQCKVFLCDMAVLAGACSWMCGAWTARWCRAAAWAPASTTRSTSAGRPTVRPEPRLRALHHACAVGRAVRRSESSPRVLDVMRPQKGLTNSLVAVRCGRFTCLSAPPL